MSDSKERVGHDSPAGASSLNETDGLVLCRVSETDNVITVATTMASACFERAAAANMFKVTCPIGPQGPVPIIEDSVAHGPCVGRYALFYRS
jgi:hypothetical protein